MKRIMEREDFRKCLYFNISKLFRITSKFAEEPFARLDICSTHGFLLLLLNEKGGGLTVNEISENLAIAPSTVTRFVDKLVIKKWVSREKDGKHSITKLTNEGKRMIPKIYEAWGHIYDSFEDTIGDLDYLRHVAINMNKFVERLEEELGTGLYNIKI